MANLCTIVVPIYQTNLSKDEWYSLKGNRKILQEFPLVIVAPKGLDLSLILEEIDVEGIQYFDKEYFASQASYNKLLYDVQFFQRFIESEYILICQLDVLIFRNELYEWCQKGFDYVGAPWLVGFANNGVVTPDDIIQHLNLPASDGEQITQILIDKGVLDQYNTMNIDAVKLLDEFQLPSRYEALRPKLVSFFQKCEEAYHKFTGVGNGGLSLRKVSTALEVLTTDSINSTASVTPLLLSDESIQGNVALILEIKKKLDHYNNLVLLQIKEESALSEMGKKGFMELPSFGEVHNIGELLYNFNQSLQEDDRKIVELWFAKLRLDYCSLYLKNGTLNEDIFWGQLAPFFLKDYKVAPIEEALYFSFDVNPAFCYEVTKQKLPFGAHAWSSKYYRSFWEDLLDDLPQ